MKLPKIPLGLIFVLLIIFLLRLPSLFEPYWYGDEGIYLVLGQAMQRGAVLYRDIWDNKPPLLYLIYAIHPTLLWAKVSATVFALGTCIGVSLLSYKLLARHLQDQVLQTLSLLAALLTGVLLSIPLLEGTIANAELYFTLPIVLGAYLIATLRGVYKDILKLYLIGFLAALAFLIKVPAVFDFLGMFVFMGIYLFEMLWEKKRWMVLGRVLFDTYAPIAAGSIIPIFLVFLYFYLNSALPDLLTASFSQNASYVSVDSGPFSKLSNPLFVKGIILVAGCLLLVAGYFKKLISKELLFLSLWFGFSLYGALLSNRNYPHYLLQIIPPVSILIVYLFAHFRKYWVFLSVPILIWVLLYNKFTSVIPDFSTGFALKPLYYYQNWFEYVSERKLWEDYVNFFDKRTLNSYAIGGYLAENSNPEDPIFVWGDAASVYVLSNRPAATRFIQSHHLTTIDPKNYELIIERLNSVKPKFIIIDRPVHFQFPMLEEFVQSYYEPVALFDDLYVYARVGKQ